MLIVGIIINVSIFSQNISKVSIEDSSGNTIIKVNNIKIISPLIIKDSSKITLIAFNEKQSNEIIKSLKLNKFNKSSIKELQKQIILLNNKNKLEKQIIDSLNTQINKYIEITITYDEQIHIKEQQISNLEKNLTDSKTIETNLNQTIKDITKRKNKTIVKLYTTNIISIGIILFLIFSN